MSEGKIKSDNLEPNPSNPVDWSDLICAVCELGGEMICCDGKCLRSFHPLCINLDEENIPEDSPFLCVDCENGLHRCFGCKKFDVEMDLIKCSLPFCGKFYHKKCMSTYKPGKPICPYHNCNECKSLNISTFDSRKYNLWRCFRCPVAYHLNHRPKDVHILSEGLFLCIKHVQEKEELPEMDAEVIQKVKEYMQMNHTNHNDKKLNNSEKKKHSLTNSKIDISDLKLLNTDSTSSNLTIHKKRHIEDISLSKQDYNSNKNDSDSDEDIVFHSNKAFKRQTVSNKSSKNSRLRLHNLKRKQNIANWQTNLSDLASNCYNMENETFYEYTDSSYLRDDQQPYPNDLSYEPGDPNQNFSERSYNNENTMRYHDSDENGQTAYQYERHEQNDQYDQYDQYDHVASHEQQNSVYGPTSNYNTNPYSYPPPIDNAHYDPSISQQQYHHRDNYSSSLSYDNTTEYPPQYNDPRGHQPTYNSYRNTNSSIYQNTSHSDYYPPSSGIYPDQNYEYDGYRYHNGNQSFNDYDMGQGQSQGTSGYGYSSTSAISHSRYDITARSYYENENMQHNIIPGAPPVKMNPQDLLNRLKASGILHK